MHPQPDSAYIQIRGRGVKVLRKSRAKVSKQNSAKFANGFL